MMFTSVQRRVLCEAVDKDVELLRTYIEYLKETFPWPEREQYFLDNGLINREVLMKDMKTFENDFREFKKVFPSEKLLQTIINLYDQWLPHNKGANDPDTVEYTRHLIAELVKETDKVLNKYIPNIYNILADKSKHVVMGPFEPPLDVVDKIKSYVDSFGLSNPRSS